jgi:hypothetical protein
MDAGSCPLARGRDASLRQGTAARALSVLFPVGGAAVGKKILYISDVNQRICICSGSQILRSDPSFFISKQGILETVLNEVGALSFDLLASSRTSGVMPP